jgi:hypothetical protein
VDDATVELEVEVFDNSGQRLGRRFVSLDGHSSRLRSLEGFGVTGVSSAYATVKVIEGDGRVAVGGSVIDNITGDPTSLDAIHPNQVAGTAGEEQHSLVAAIAHSKGALGSVWRSGLAIVNQTSASQTVTLRYEVEYDRTGAFDGSGEEVVTIPAGHQAHWEDVLVELFGIPENAKTQGALHVFSPAGLMIDSRTYNVRSDGGTFGLGLPGLKSGDLVSTDGKAGIINGLIHSDETRTNIGLAEYSGQGTTVSVYFRTTILSGAVINSITQRNIEIPPDSHFQLLRVFDGAQVDTLQGVEATVVVESGGSVYSYATTIDNASGDPTAFTAAKE